MPVLPRPRARAADATASWTLVGRLLGVDEQRDAVPRDAALPRPGAGPRRRVHLQAGHGRAAAGRLPGRDARAARGRGVRGVARRAGWGIVPPTVLRDGPFGEGMVQLWIDVDETVDPVGLVIDEDERLRPHRRVRRRGQQHRPQGGPPAAGPRRAHLRRRPRGHASRRCRSCGRCSGAGAASRSRRRRSRCSKGYGRTWVASSAMRCATSWRR